MCYIQSVTAKLYNTLKTYRNVSAPRIRWGARGTHTEPLGFERTVNYVKQGLELLQNCGMPRLSAQSDNIHLHFVILDEAASCSCTSTVSRHEKTARWILEAWVIHSPMSARTYFVDAALDTTFISNIVNYFKAPQLCPIDQQIHQTQ
jgi:hypothetical protein